MVIFWFVFAALHLFAWGMTGNIVSLILAVIFAVVGLFYLEES